MIAGPPENVQSTTTRRTEPGRRYSASVEICRGEPSQEASKVRNCCGLFIGCDWKVLHTAYPQKVAILKLTGKKKHD